MSRCLAPHCKRLAVEGSDLCADCWCTLRHANASAAVPGIRLDDTHRAMYATRIERATLAGWFAAGEAIRLLRMLMHDVPRFLEERDAWAARGIDLRESEWDDPAICTTAPLARRTLSTTQEQENRG